jgi:PAS domain S-box-containing protein
MDPRPESELLQEIETLRQELKAGQAREAEWERTRHAITTTPAEDEHFITISRDISARQRAEEALRVSAERHQAILQAALDGFALVDLQGRLLEVNAAYCRMSGYSEDELLDRRISDLESVETAGDAAAHIQRVVTRGAERFETRQRRKDGSLFDVEVSVQYQPMDGGRMVAFLRDITERKRAEEAARQREREFSTLVEHAPDMIVRFDTDLRHIYSNAAVERQLGISARTFLGKTALEAGTPPAQAEFITRSLRQVQETGSELEVEQSFPTQFGNRYFQTRIVPERDARGRIESLLAITRDITERKQAEEALREREEKYRQLFNNAEAGMFRTRLDGSEILEFNEKFLRILGYTSEEVRATPSAVMWADQSERNRMVQLLQAEGHVTDFECELLNKQGEARRCVTSLRLYPDQGILEGSIQDITERKRAEEALRQLNAQLEQRVAERTAQVDAKNQELNTVNAQLKQALRSRDEFLASMSHELRTPLTGILGLSEMLQLDIYGPLTEKQRHAVKTVYDSGQHLLALITDILDLAKTSAGKLELQVGPVSVPDVCRASIELVSGQARKKNLRLALNLDQAPSRLEADERRLKQILVNLLGNAVKFTPDGGQVGLEVSVDAPQGRALFVVWDTGIGIAPEMMPHLFQPFVQLDNRLNRDNVGTGLGLALVHQLVTLHGGSISLESSGRPGQGSRFTVALPWSAPAVEGFPLAADPPGPGHAAVSLPPGMAGARILVADDNPTTLAVLHDVLAAHGFQVAAAHNGFEALALARALPPALMVLDVQMPGLDGLEVARQVRADPALAAIPIIALTALAMPGDRERCLAAGANAYEIKPVSLPKLLGRIGALIARGGENHAE